MEFTSKNLTFVIVSFKSEKVIFNCLNSLPKDFKKIVVENSHDEFLKNKLEQNYDNITVILSENVGMGSGNNKGIQNSETDYVYILNPDVTFNQTTIIDLNYSMKEIDDFYILSPISDNKDYPNFRDQKQDFISKNIISVSEIDGYSMVINKKKFKKQNFFDEKIFMYLENVDLCIRILKEKGKIFLVKNSSISHLGAKGVDSKYFFEVECSRNWHWMWSKVYFYKKHKSALNLFFMFLTNFFSCFFKYLFLLLIFNKKKKIYYLRLSGLINSFMGKPSWYRPKID